MKSVRDIIFAAGIKELHKKSLQPGRKPLTVATIYSWLRYGIPEKNWDLVMSIVKDVKPETLHTANKRLRDGKDPKAVRIRSKPKRAA